MDFDERAPEVAHPARRTATAHPSVDLAADAARTVGPPGALAGDMQQLPARQVLQLQRQLGNRALCNLIAPHRAAACSDANQTVQRQPKGEPLPGRKTRRREAEEDALAEMDRLNEEWEANRTASPADPTHNPYAALPDTELVAPALGAPALGPPVVAAPTPTRPTLAELNTKDRPTLRALLAPHYSEEVVGQMIRLCMSRTPGSGSYINVDQLAKAARSRLATHRDGGSSNNNNSSLFTGNVKRGTVPGLVKGKSEFDAGEGKTWHIHFRDHMKYGRDDTSRINFAGRTQADILAAVDGLSPAQRSLPNFDVCRAWIVSNL